MKPAASAGSPLVSCVLPAHDAAAHLPGAIENLLAQTYRPLEIVVADDGSTDETAEIAAAFGPPVRLVRQAEAGPAATRNLGLREARGELVAFLDPDDLWHPDKLAIQVGRLRARADLDCSVTHAELLFADPEDARRVAGQPRAGTVPGYATTTLLARREAFERVGALDDSLWFADATDWFLRARAHGLAIELLPDALVLHRVHAANLTRRRAHDSEDEFLRVVKRSLDRRRARERS